MRTATLMLSALACSLCLAAQPGGTANLSLKAGYFYGPGDQGIHPFNNAAVRNISFTGPFTGVIPFFNNGAEPPNVSAEILQGGVVDGYTSDGRAINENIDTGLHLVLNDPVSGESANMMVVATQAEAVGTDALGNLVFNTHVFADPGSSSLVTPLDVTFTTGAARVPLSLKTQQGITGGVDRAGPFPAGYVLFGRIGDFDHDGFMDGELVLAANSPLDLIVARGNPIAQRRPWVSDIPINAPLSAELNLANIVSNFPQPLIGAASAGQRQLAAEYAYDLTSRLNAVLFDLSAILSAKSTTRAQKSRARTALFAVRSARDHFDRGIDVLTKVKHDDDRHGRYGGGDSRDAARAFHHGLKHLGFALQMLALEFPLPSAGMAKGAASTAEMNIE
jgi:hypothetical protein